ncbi:MAG: TonB-dependent receptor plug [Bacteroidetes bacterium]|nr:MAG: TonB-dependent receptor plug [Bacteroidota bacterium]
MFHKYVFLFSFLSVTGDICAQQLTQTVRGQVMDKNVQAPLIGAVITVVGSDPLKGATTDINGSFKIEKVPVGRQNLRISYTGYKEELIPNLDVTSGKEVVLNIGMEETVQSVEEVEITGNARKDRPQNDMSTVSTRTFSVEETQRYAAAVNDPARMALSFAGVSAPGDGNNDIVIRGNSPNGLLWRMDGIDIPSPNHFSYVGAAGGGISILSAQLLANSDFSTGAFAPEYGNALSGVFDLKLRKGNNEKREYTFQAGVLGIDAAAEGPLGKKGGSYLVNYRYSTLGILSKIGVPLGDAVTTFQDLSYNISLPAGKAGTFGFFGFGGLSDQHMDANRDSSAWEYESDRYFGVFRANTGMAGFTHALQLNENMYLRTALAISGTVNESNWNRIDDNYNDIVIERERFVQPRISFSSVMNRKINPKNHLRQGLIVSRPGYDLLQQYKPDSSATLKTEVNSKGNTFLLQYFTQWKHRFGERFAVVSGLHYLHFALNNTWSVEPRISVKWDATERQSFSLGYGLHSQVQPLGMYFAEVKLSDGSIVQPNKDLGFTKAHHFVAGYDLLLAEHLRLKMEVYYQALFNIPIRTGQPDAFSGIYSILNSQGGYFTDSLANKGTGSNKGLELTFEKFFSDNYYFLLSSSIYDSKYKGADGVERNTRFNGNYTVSLTAGKEIVFKKGKRRTLGFNLKGLFTGGLRTIPIDLAASNAAGEEQLAWNRAFEDQNPYYLRLDSRVSLKTNRKKMTTILALDFQNTTNRKNVYGRYYNKEKGIIEWEYQTPLIPVLSYKIMF